MFVDLVRFKTKDNVELSGFIVGSDPAKAILYVHGLHSNFYRSRAEVLAGIFNKLGYVFFSFNNRGAERGADSEDFKKCVYDISAAVNFIRRRGIRDIILAGHSTGCNKIVYALSKKKFSGVRGVILLAGLSDPEIFEATLGRQYKKVLLQAEKLVRARRGHEYLLVSKTHGAMTASRIVSLFTYGGAEDLFSLSLGKKAKPRFKGLTMPTLIVYGTRDQHAYHPVQKIGAFVAAQIPGPTEQVYIKGARHGFKGYERKLMGRIVQWLCNM